MKTEIIAYTKNALEQARRIQAELKKRFQCNVHAFKSIHGIKDNEKFRDTKILMDNIFHDSDAVVFVSAAGIAVRSIAPYIKSKTSDPAVVVVSENGRYVIPLLSGHIGGANRLAREIAEITGGDAVITTATDINGIFAVDVYAKDNNLYIKDMAAAKEVSALLLRGEKIGFVSDFSEYIPYGLTDIDTETDIGICISYDENKRPFKITLNLIPMDIVLGIGCKRGTDASKILGTIKEVLKENKISIKAVTKLASIDLKADEAGITEVAETVGVHIEFYDAETLKGIEGEFSESEFVKSVAGVGNVCERAAVCGAGGGRLIIKKYSQNGVTVAAAVIKGH